MWRKILGLSFMGLTALAQTAPPAELKLDLGAGVSMDLVLVLPGIFTQGSSPTETGREADETAREVTISKAYYIGKYPVTVGQFTRFVETSRYRTEAEKGESGGFGVENGKLVQRAGFNWRDPGFTQSDDHPVVIVTAQDAKAFCRWLTNLSGHDCTLPSEAQWEYASRAGTTGAHYLEPVNDVAWHRGNSDAQTHPVGQKKANAWGLHDFYGPVWQWCSDWYAPYPAGPATDPLQTNPNLSDKPRQVLRGGSFMSDVSHSRSAERYRNDPFSRNADNGFRIVSSVASRPVAAAPKVQPGSEQPQAFEPSSEEDGEPTIGPAPMFILIFGAFCLIALGVVVTVVYFIGKAIFGAFRRAPSSSPLGSDLTPRQAADFFSAKPKPLSGGFSFRLSDSGFYITGPENAVGTQVQYSANVGDQIITDDVLFSPGPEGQFIFTGTRPKSVSVRTTGGMAGTSSDSSFSSFDDDHYRRSSFGSSSSSSRSYPSAY